MFFITTTERRNAIIDYLRSRPNSDVKDIIAQFDVTPATIRRDLSYLKDAGKITRTHGAVHLVSSSSVPGFLTRINHFSEEKKAIAKMAAALVHSGDSVLLDSGTTVHAVANEIKEIPDITIITNSLAMISALDAPKQNILLTGGVVDYENLALIGPDAEAFLDRVSASILFLETTGFRGCDGMTVVSPFQASIKQKMLARSQKRVLVDDGSKFSVPGMLLFAPFTSLDTVIFAHPVQNPELKKHLEQAGVEILVAMP